MTRDIETIVRDFEESHGLAPTFCQRFDKTMMDIPAIKIVAEYNSTHEDELLPSEVEDWLREHHIPLS